MKMDKVIELKNVTKEYIQGEDKVIALKDINLDISRGEFVVILGPSGSGKSTLLHLVGGLDMPTKGEVIINGKNIGNCSDEQLAEFRRKTIGFVFQSYHLIPVLTVEENVTMPILLDHKKVDQEYLQYILRQLEIEDFKRRVPSQLSGGQQQRVAIARALMNRPGIILADEPTGNLDVETSNQVVTLLKNSCRELGQTLVMITHNREIAKYADRIVTIRNGEVSLG